MPNPILKYFNYTHLKEPLRSVSERFTVLAEEMERALPDSAEKSAGMRKLLEAKDCFVRAAIPSFRDPE